jgi:hypothetical protein
MNLAQARKAKAPAAGNCQGFLSSMTETESRMTDVNSNTLTHTGIYLTKIEKRDNGDIIIVQTNKRGTSDCVILPADLAGSVAALIKAKTKRAA